MAEKMAEQIAEILKESDYHTGSCLSLKKCEARKSMKWCERIC